MGKGEFTPEVDRLCAFSSVPAKDKDYLKFLLKSYNALHQSTSLQLNSGLASITQMQDEISGWADGDSAAPFNMQSNAPESWAMWQAGSVPGSGTQPIGHRSPTAARLR